MIKKLLLIILVLGCLGLAGLLVYQADLTGKVFLGGEPSPAPAKDLHLEFVAEVYESIKQNYWDKISDADLAIFFKLAVEKLIGSSAPVDPKNKDEVVTLTNQIIKDFDSDKKTEFVTQMSDLVLVNLKPFGRSRLYTVKQEKELKNSVQNRDTLTDLYAVLDVSKAATTKEIRISYQKKVEELENDESSKAKEKLAQVNRAFETLAQPERKEVYDKTGIEPTVIYRLLTPNIFYIKLSKFSPQSFEELEKAANSIDPKKKGGPIALIFDLRGNIGGAIDILQYFLGPFIGPNRYAYDFFHQENTEPFKTKIGWFDGLVRYKKVIILIDEKSQSSAEVMAAAMKKYNVGVLIGVPTKGWGTVEKVFPIENQIDSKQKFSMLLVHSLTLRDDGQPIEGRGVDPTINLNDKDWPQQLMAYFNYPELVSVVRELIK